MNKIRNSYTLRFTLLVFVCIFISSILILVASVISSFLGWPGEKFDIITFTVVLAIFSLLIGTISAYFVSRRMTKQQKEIEKVINEVVSGNFDVQIPVKTGASEQMTKDINKMIRELKNVEMLKTDFISNFSHEFKTPIVSIKGFSEILLNEKLSAKKQKEFLKIIYDESDRLSKLSSNMLLLSNLESSAIVPEKKQFALNEQISSAVKLLTNEATAKNLTININLQEVSFYGNDSMMLQVWINLINNAIKYSNENGIIEISLEEFGKSVKIKIKDNGMGISDEDLPHIFDKFYQADRSHGTVGNGLGLSIAKQIVILHGGVIFSNLVKGEFTEFVVELPIVNS